VLAILEDLGYTLSMMMRGQKETKTQKERP
jgi:hypothetical protein